MQKKKIPTTPPKTKNKQAKPQTKQKTATKYRRTETKYNQPTKNEIKPQTNIWKPTKRTPLKAVSKCICNLMLWFRNGISQFSVPTEHSKSRTAHILTSPSPFLFPCGGLERRIRGTKGRDQRLRWEQSTGNSNEIGKQTVAATILTPKCTRGERFTQ